MDRQRVLRWDVFISHASEDKEDFVRALALALRDEGLRVWYDEFSLKLGDSLSRSLDQGLANSEFGIVVLSPNFFAKEWPRRELDGLVAREVAGGKVILPLWHNVTMDDVRNQSPTLADRVAVDTARGLKGVVQSILEIVQPVPLRTLEIAAESLSRLRHELISSLDGILAHTEWLVRRLGSETSLNEDIRSRVNYKLGDIGHMAKLMEMILETMIPIGDPPHLSLTTVAVKEIAHTSAGFLLQEAKRKRVQVEIEFQSLPKLRADRSLLLRLMYNLVKNAIDYAEPEGDCPYVRITGEQRSDRIQVSILDNGIGIVPGEEELIFGRFRRGSNALSVHPVGTGLGLTFSRWVAEEHGGTLVVQNPRKPTIFRLTLPCIEGTQAL